MQALKALVIFLAVLIVAGMVLLVYGLMTRTGGEGGRSTAGAPAAAGAQPPAPAVDFGTLDLEIPDGCSLAGSELAGDRLVVHVTGQPGRGCQQLVIVDLLSGRELGRVKAVPSSLRAAP